MNVQEIGAMQESLRLEVLRAQTSNLGRSWSSRNGRMPEGRIYLIDRGTAVVKHHGRTYQMVPGNLYLIPAYTDLVYCCEKFAVCYWCHFRAELHGRIDLFSCVDCDYVVPLADHDAVRGIFERLQVSFNSSATGRGFALAGGLQQLLAFFIDTAVPARGHRDLIRLQPVLAYISENLADPIRVEDLAEIARLETTYFSRVFSRTFGEPPAKYIISRRVEAAQRMLWHGDRSVGEIAERLGFCDAFHFSKTFKRIAGVSPTAYRKSRRLVP